MRDANGNELKIGDTVTISKPIGPLRFVGMKGTIVKLGTINVHINTHMSLLHPSEDAKPRVVSPNDVLLGIHNVSSAQQDQLEQEIEAAMETVFLRFLSKAVSRKIISQDKKIALLSLYDEQEWL